MKANEKGNKKEELVTVTKKSLLALVASQLKGRDLFPEKIEEAKRYFHKLKPAHS